MVAIRHSLRPTRRRRDTRGWVPGGSAAGPGGVGLRSRRIPPTPLHERAPGSIACVARWCEPEPRRGTGPEWTRYATRCARPRPAATATLEGASRAVVRQAPTGSASARDASRPLLGSRVGMAWRRSSPMCHVTPPAGSIGCKVSRDTSRAPCCDRTHRAYDERSPDTRRHVGTRSVLRAAVVASEFHLERAAQLGDLGTPVRQPSRHNRGARRAGTPHGRLSTSDCVT